MGAAGFTTTGTGSNAKEAFRSAVRQAQQEEGSAGYTGSIAEKRDFVLLSLPPDTNPSDYGALRAHAYGLMDTHKLVSDTWGPAGAFDLGGGRYFFFGWASS